MSEAVLEGFEASTGGNTAPLASEIKDGYFSFFPKRPKKNQDFGKEDNGYSSKAFIDPARALMIADTPGGELRIEAKRSSPKSIAPEQSCIEIYNECAYEDAKSILELEWHAPYKHLEPGQSMRAEQCLSI